MTSTNSTPAKGRARTKRKRRRPKRMNREQKEEYLELMQLGAPPLLGFQKVDITLDDMRQASADDEWFGRQISQVGDLLAANVNSAVYKAAMGGNVTAQGLYLRNYHLLRKNDERPRPELNRLDGKSARQLKEMIARVSAPWGRKGKRKRKGVASSE